MNYIKTKDEFKQLFNGSKKEAEFFIVYSHLDDVYKISSKAEWIKEYPEWLTYCYDNDFDDELEMDWSEFNIDRVAAFDYDLNTLFKTEAEAKEFVRIRTQRKKNKQ